jgi:hypothetical protein
MIMKNIYLNLMNLNRFGKLNKPIALLGFSTAIGYWIYKNTDIETRINTFLNKSLTNLKLEKAKAEKSIKFNDKNKLVIYSNENFYDSVAKYLYKKYPEKINNFYYDEEKIFTFNEFRYRRKEKPKNIKLFKPEQCNFNIYYEYDNKEYEININLSYVLDNNNQIVKIMESVDCSSYEALLSKIEATCVNKEALVSFIDSARSDIKKDYDETKKCSNETMRIFYYRKDYWSLLAKAPKRPIETIYLKEGVRDSILTYINDFFSKETRDIYLSFGIPYKSVSLIYGPPGSGKTSIIKGIASSLDCDLYVLPITKDMLDNDFVGAFSYINDEEEKQKIIVIEDIDSLFDERKEGDNHNGITLQGFLNCLDGFTCIEGTMLFLTANKPEVLDYAIIRSCRIDHKIELGYADKYQTREMFERFLPEQKERFKDFYDTIKHKEYTTASLQEFLFYNRKCENILEIVDKFTEIIEKNDPKNFEVIKDENKNFYS